MATGAVTWLRGRLLHRAPARAAWAPERAPEAAPCRGRQTQLPLVPGELSGHTAPASTRPGAAPGPPNPAGPGQPPARISPARAALRGSLSSSAGSSTSPAGSSCPREGQHRGAVRGLRSWAGMEKALRSSRAGDEALGLREPGERRSPAALLVPS